MLAVPVGAEALIAEHHLGTLKKIYKPNTVLSIIVGSCLIAFACVWIMFALGLTGNPLLPANQLPFPSSALPPSIDPTFTMLPTILSIVFPLIGLIFIGVGFRILIMALLNQQVRAVLCEHGVAYLRPREAGAFRWEQVATVLDRTSIHTSTTDQSGSIVQTSRTISHTYTVVCKDGRRFIFNTLLNKVEQLGEDIQSAVALYQQSV